MSLSQKHSGKVFVPWYNAAEWKTVYEKLQSEDSNDRQWALEVLEIWKIRTPLLSAGVEGTMIILRALLLCDKENLSESEIADLALSLLRFLNLCAANNEKQGTFNKTASENDLPRWLIHIRHDIAHHHHLPSKSTLQSAITQSFQWLMEKYWKQQNDLITDYVITEASLESNSKVPSILDVYIRLSFHVLNGISMSEVDQGLMAKLNYVVNKRSKRNKDITPAVFLEILQEMLIQYLESQEDVKVGCQIAKILVTDKAMLATHVETTPEGADIIPKDFRNLWSNLINILYEHSLIISLVDQFLEVTNNASLTDSHRKVASIWITEIFDGLLSLQIIKEELESIKEAADLDRKTSRIILKSIITKKNPQMKDCLEFKSIDKLPIAEAKQFEDKMLKQPNEFMLNFLERVMTFNKNCNAHIIETKGLVEIMSGHTKSTNWGEEIFTIDNLTSATGLNLNVEEVTQEDEEMALVQDIGGSNHPVPEKRWQLIKDTSYQGLPLGILPNQWKQKNPLLFVL